MKSYLFLLACFFLLGCDQSPKKSTNVNEPEESKGTEQTGRQYKDAWITAETPTKLRLNFWLSESNLEAWGGIKGFKNGSKASITPVFVEHKDGHDIYNVRCKYPLDSDLPSETTKELRFDGTSSVTADFPAQKLMITIYPKEPKSGHGGANEPATAVKEDVQ